MSEKMTAKQFLKKYRIYEDEAIHNVVGDNVGTLTQLMEDYRIANQKTLSPVTIEEINKSLEYNLSVAPTNDSIEAIKQAQQEFNAVYGGGE